MDTTVWTGSSGKHYTYEVHSSLANWNSVGGNYIFASVIPGRWKAHHVGQTGDFRSCFSSHEKWAEAVRAGATHILVHTNPSEVSRRLVDRLFSQIRPVRRYCCGRDCGWEGNFRYRAELKG